MLLLAVETVVAGLLHQKVFDHALVLGLLHGPRVGLAHVHVVAGKYQVKYTHSLSLHSCYYHYHYHHNCFHNKTFNIQSESFSRVVDGLLNSF